MFLTAANADGLKSVIRSRSCGGC